MPGKRYPFLDLTVLPQLRHRVVSAAATVLFAADMSEVLWANAPGAALFGGSDLAELIEHPLSANQPFVRQLRDATAQIEGEETLVRGFRVARGLRSEFIQCELSAITLPDGEQAVLLVRAEDRLARPASEHELAEAAVNSLSGLAIAAAIVDDYGLAVAATDSYADIDLSPEDLSALIEEAASEDDRLVKRAEETGTHEIVAIGVARLNDKPGRYLVVCAEADDDEVSPEGAGAAIATASEVEASAPDTSHETPLWLPGEAMQSDEPDGESDTEAVEESFAEAIESLRNGSAEELAMEETSEPEPPAPEPVALGQPPVELTPPEDWEDEELEPEPEETEASESGQSEEREEEPAAKDETEEDGEEPPAPSRTRRPSLLDRWYLGLTGFGGKPAETEAAASEAEDTGEASEETDDFAIETTAEEAPEVPLEETPEEAEAEAPVAGIGYEEAEPIELLDAGTEAAAEEIPEEEANLEGEASDNETLDDEISDEEALAEEISGEESGDENGEFVFAGDGEPVRFAWIIDTDHEFRSVSPELAKTVGPNAADIVGRKWNDVANVFGFDTGGEVRRLLERRDTWSGKSVLWPVQGTDLVVPVDLAALPAFDAQRRFDGFRGFGIIRTSDAIIDPNETGLALVPGRPPSTVSTRAQTPDEEAASDEIVEERRIGGIDAREEADSDAKPGNVVNLAHRRSQDALDELSRRESQAFSEIGRKLREGEASNKNSQSTQSPAETDEAKPEAEGIDDKSGTSPAKPVSAQNVKTGAAGGITTDILEQLPVPVLVFRNGVTLYANAELLELSGYASIDELSAAGGVDALLSGRTEEDGISRATLTKKDGQTMDISPLLQTVPWNDFGVNDIETGDGEAGGEEAEAGKALLLSFRPSTSAGPLPSHEKIALDMARVSELQNILDTATDGIIIADKHGVIESINPSAEALFGIDLSQATGQPLANLFAQESQKTLGDYIAEFTQSDLSFKINDGREVIGKEANGGLIPLFITIGPVGAAEKFCVVLRDMTHWKKVEEELVNAKRAAELASEQKTDFLARVSHEIRTPLNAIIGFSDVMLEERFGPVGNDRYREYLRDINRSGVHVLDLINDLLDISKIEAGKMELTYEAVDLNQIVAETVALLQPQANRERIIIRTSLSRAVPRVVADARSIRQIILNLVSNAIKFTPENGQVIVSTVYEGNGEVALRVRDTGKGMSEAEIDNAMKPFQQLAGIDEKRGQGTGLGLPLTKALVEANRAYFDLESTPGEGTIAHVHFPTQRVLAD